MPKSSESSRIRILAIQKNSPTSRNSHSFYRRAATSALPDKLQPTTIDVCRVIARGLQFEFRKQSYSSRPSHRIGLILGDGQIQ